MKNDPADFQVAFNRLRSILRPYAPKMVVVKDTFTEYFLDTTYCMPNKKTLFFAAARLSKAYASFHLMPLYVTPELVTQISPELKKRMQGKSCFNFKQSDEKLFSELTQLTKRGFESYHHVGYV